MQAQGMEQAGMTSDKDWTVLLILSIVLGSLGVDHFYSGKIGTGILKLITFGGCGIWWLIDVIMIATGSFKDSNGIPIVKWLKPLWCRIIGNQTELPSGVLLWKSAIHISHVSQFMRHNDLRVLWGLLWLLTSVFKRNISPSAVEQLALSFGSSLSLHQFFLQSSTSCCFLSGIFFREP